MSRRVLIVDGGTAGWPAAGYLTSIREVIQKTALAKPPHQDFIDRHSRAEPAELRALAAAASSI